MNTYVHRVTAIKYDGTNLEEIQRLFGDRVRVTTFIGGSQGVLFRDNAGWDDLYPGCYIVTNKDGYSRRFDGEVFERQYEYVAG